MKKSIYLLIIAAITLTFSSVKAEENDCTGITLKSKDGGVIVSRTVEWSLSDAQHNKILIVPRNRDFISLTPEGATGMQWKGKFGFITMTAYG